VTRGVAVVPESRPAMHQALTAAVKAAGAEIVPLAHAEAVVWADPAAVGMFRELIDEATAASWVQLPYAGI